MNTHRVNTRLAGLWAVVAATRTLTAPAAQAQTWPSKPIKIVVPFPAGGTSDVLARLLGKELGEVYKQPVIVENLGGVSGAIAAQKVLNAPADGQAIARGLDLLLQTLSTASR